MMTLSEKAPLRFLHLSEAGIALGATLSIGGMWTLLVGAERYLVEAIIAIAIGLAIALIAGFYRGCANGACTPDNW